MQHHHQFQHYQQHQQQHQHQQRPSVGPLHLAIPPGGHAFHPQQGFPHTPPGGASPHMLHTPTFGALGAGGGAAGLSAGAAPFQPGGGGGGSAGKLSPANRSPSFLPASARLGASNLMPQYMSAPASGVGSGPGGPSLSPVPMNSLRQPPPRLNTLPTPTFGPGMGGGGGGAPPLSPHHAPVQSFVPGASAAISPGGSAAGGVLMPSPGGGVGGGAGVPSPLAPNFVPAHLQSAHAGGPAAALAARGGGPGGGVARRGKGPITPHTPFKIRGHNSTPSISQSPAAFAAGLAASLGGGAAAAPKPKKMVVQLPREGGTEVEPDAAEARVAADIAAERQGAGAAAGAAAAAEPSDEERRRKDEARTRRAREAALVRARWKPRRPLAELPMLRVEYAALAPGVAETAPLDGFVASRAAYPEPWPYSQGLPNSIEIYLPGRASWDEYREDREEERAIERERELARQRGEELEYDDAVHDDDDGGGALVEGRETGVDQLRRAADEGEDDEDRRTFGEGDERELGLSISSPADPSVVSDRLNSYLESQKHLSERGQPDVLEGEPTGLPPVPAQLSRLGRLASQELPSRLREAALAQLNKRSSSSEGYGHGQTMSLSMPSSGGPFGPGVLSALGLRASDVERSSLSDTEDQQEPALGERPPLHRGPSEGSARAGADAVGARGARAATASKAQTLIDLGRGFGYDIEEADEDVEEGKDDGAMGAGDRGSHVPPSPPPADEFAEELRTNPSEDADGSEQADGSDDGSDYGSDDGSDDDDDDDSLADSMTPSDEEFSNPSDEEAAHAARMQRRALRAEMRAARTIQRQRRRAEARRQEGGGGAHHSAGKPQRPGRPRRDTVDTLPSSGIGEQDHGRFRPRPGYQRQAHAVVGGGGGGGGHALEDDIISNPSDEEAIAAARRGVADGRGGPLDDGDDDEDAPWQRAQRQQQFRFPSQDNAVGPGAATAQARPMLKGTSSMGLNPAAKEFRFGGAPAPAVASAEDKAAHYRLPSINRSSFGGSAFGSGGGGDGGGHSRTGSRQLKATAPSFKPGAFTFSAPAGAPSMPPQLQVGSTLEAVQQAAVLRDEQGREKRVRHEASRGPLDDDVVVGDVASGFGGGYEAAHSPPRPGPSAASIEGPMRMGEGGHGLGSIRPFDVNGTRQRMPQLPPQAAAAAPVQPPSGNFTFKPTAPSFTPTWGRTAGIGATLRRAGIPTFGEPDAPPSQTSSSAQAQQQQLSIQPRLPSTEFSFAAGSRPVAIRRPEEQDVQDQENRDPASADAVRAAATAEAQSIAPSTGPQRMPLAAVRRPDPRLAELESYGRSPSMAIPIGSHGGARGGGRAHSRRDSSSSLAMSLDRQRLRRSDAPGVGSNASDRDLDDDDDDDSGTVSDIIEELGERMDRALEGWAGKILDEVTIMGQVRPTHIGLDAAERGVLLDEMSAKIQASFADHFERLKALAMQQQQARLAIEATASSERGDTGATDGATATTRGSGGRAPRLQSGHPPLDAQGELDFDYVTEVLDQKIANLQRDLTAAFDTALPRALESIPKPAQTAATTAPALPAPTAPVGPVTLSEQASEAIAALLEAKVRAALAQKDEVTEARRMAELTASLHTAVNEAVERSAAHAKSTSTGRAEADDAATRSALPTPVDVEALQSALQGAIGARLTEALSELPESLSDKLEVSLVKALVPHVEMLRTEPVDADMVAARVTEILAPMIEERRHRFEQERKESEDRVESAAVAAAAAAAAEASRTPSTGGVEPEQIAQATLEKLEPLVRGIKSEPLDTDDIVARVSEVVGRQSIEHMVDLNPVIALLEPLVSKQEEARSLSRQIMDRQSEVESTLGVLPAAINAKTEIFLSATQQTHDAQAEMLKKLEGLASTVQAASFRAAELDERRDALLQQLDEARREASERKAEADEARAELSAANGYSATLKEELTRLEARLDQAERDAGEVTDQINAAKTREEKATERAHAAERQLDEAWSATREARSAKEGAESQATMLRAHIDELRAELKAMREDRSQEREAAAQATAEALAHGERMEKALKAAEERGEARLREAQAESRDMAQRLQEAQERAARAEGEAAALEKRVSEQDGKIGSLQQVNATQKQKAAQSQQKLSEGEKRLREYEAQEKELAVARARLEEMESRVADREELEARLRASQESEAKIRDEITTYHSRFLDLEKDLITMKETLVGRDELEAALGELAASREEVARLSGQLSERNAAAAAAVAAAAASQAQLQQQHATVAPYFDSPHAASSQRKSFGAWADEAMLPSASSSMWASVHAPASQDYHPSNSQGGGGMQGIGHDESFESVHAPTPSSWAAQGVEANGIASAPKHVERGDDGWWS